MADKPARDAELSRKRSWQAADRSAVSLLIVILVVGILIFNPWSGKAQSPALPPRFETALIELSAGSGKASTSWSRRELKVKNASLQNLIQMAYQVRDFQISRGPAWINSDHYDIEAKPRVAPIETKESVLKSIDEMHLMLQFLLNDRFKLKVHRETKELPVYALTVAKGGHRMQRSKDSSCAAFEWHRNDPPLGRMPFDRCGAVETGPNIQLNHTLDAVGMSISTEQVGKTGRTTFGSSDLTTFLSRCCGLDRLVVDKTGLTGLFDLHLEWSVQATADPRSSDEFTNPSIFTAVQEQLGLKLEPTKGPVEILVIDHVEKLHAN